MTQSDSLERVQRMVTRDICRRNGQSDLSYSSRLEYLDIVTLKNRRLIQLLKFLFKIMYNFPDIPSHLFNQIVILEDDEEGRTIITPFVRIETSNKYIIHYCAKIFNNLPKSIRNENNFSSFKSKLKIYFKCQL